MFSSHQLVYIFHILVVAPLLIYLGLCSCKGCNSFAKRIALIFGITVLVYHAYKLQKTMTYKPIEKDEDEKIKPNTITPETGYHQP
jgi:hypothetical protein